METTADKIKVGSYTLAFSLIVLGTAFLAMNLGFLEADTVLILWPFLLIGLGVEYFVRKLTAGNREVQFSLPSTILIGLMAITASAANALFSINPGNIMNEIFFHDKPAYVRQWQEQPIALEKGSRLEIDNRLGDIQISASPDNLMRISARIEARGTSSERAKAAAEAEKIYMETGPVTRVFTRSEGGFTGNNVAVRMNLEIPAGLRVNASNKAGSILVQGTSAEFLTLEASMGKVEVENHTGNLRVSNKMGDIKLKDIQGDSEIEESTGRIAIDDPAGNVTAFSLNGTIELQSNKPLDKTYELKGHNGQIIFSLPRNSNLKIQAVSNHGNITGMERSIQGTDNRGDLTLGEGKGTALLEIKNGSIKLNLRD